MAEEFDGELELDFSAGALALFAGGLAIEFAQNREQAMTFFGGKSG